MKTYLEMARSSYDAKRCSEAFQQLSRNPKSPELVAQVIEQAMPVLGCHLSTTFRLVIRPDTDEYDEVLSSIPMALYEYLSSDRFYRRYYDNPDTLFAFLYGLIRYEILNVLKRTRRSSRVDPAVIPRLGTAHSSAALESSAFYVEMKILADELPRYFRSEVLKDLRFEGEDRLICETILQQVIDSEGVPWALISTRFRGVPRERVKFLAEHIIVRLKEVIESNRAIIDNLPYVADCDAAESERLMAFASFEDQLHSLPAGHPHPSSRHELLVEAS